MGTFADHVCATLHGDKRYVVFVTKLGLTGDKLTALKMDHKLFVSFLCIYIGVLD